MTQAAPPTTITLMIDGREVSAPAGATVLEAAADAGIYIPTLCYDSRIKSYGACRMCLVEQEGRPGYAASCVTPAMPNAAYRTNTDQTVELRQSVLNLLMSEHPHGCLTCDRIVHCGPNDICLRNVSVTDRCVVCPQNQRCELQATVEIVGVTEQLLPYNYRELPVRTDDPHIDRDYNLCISCARCVRVCDEVIGAEAISMVDRADRILPGTPNDVPLSDPLSGCIFCGACVDMCPVGALTEKDNKWAGLPEQTVTTVCTECEVGCQVTAELKDGRLLRVTPDIDGGANGGLACIHGKFELADEARHEARLVNAFVRAGSDGDLAPATWDDAIATAAGGLMSRRGEQAAVVISPRMANEDAYLLQKLARAGLGTPHVASTTGAPARTSAEITGILGTGASTNPVQDIARSKAVLVVGADLEVTHPVAAFQVHKAVNYEDATLIGIGPERYPELGRTAQLWLTCAPGGEVATLTGILRAVLDAGLIDDDFVGRAVDGLDQLTAAVGAQTLDEIAADAGVTTESLREAARMVAIPAPAAFLYSAREDDPAGISALLTDLALLTGNVGREDGGGLHVFRPGGGNAQGLLDVGASTGLLPGHRSVGSDADRQTISEAWNTPIPAGAGADLDGIIDGVLGGTITALYWIGGVPDGLGAERMERLSRAFREVEFLVVQGLVVDDEILSAADVVLPAAAAVEREGTYTNVERRVQRVRPVLDAPGDARPVWEAPAAIGRAIGAQGFDFTSAEAVFGEIAAVVPQYTGISYDVLDRGLTGLAWPLHADHSSGERLYTGGGFGHASGRAGLATV